MSTLNNFKKTFKNLLICGNFLDEIFLGKDLTIGVLSFNFIFLIVKSIQNTQCFTSKLKFSKTQKQHFADVFQNRCSLKFRNFHRKHLCCSLVLTKLIKERLQHRCFPVKFKNTFLRNTFSGCF